MANGGSRRGLYGEGRRTAVAAETHSPPHVQRASLALVIEGGGGSEAKSGSEAEGGSGNEEKKKVYIRASPGVEMNIYESVSGGREEYI